MIYFFITTLIPGFHPKNLIYFRIPAWWPG